MVQLCAQGPGNDVGLRSITRNIAKSNRFSLNRAFHFHVLVCSIIQTSLNPNKHAPQKRGVLWGGVSSHGIGRPSSLLENAVAEKSEKGSRIARRAKKSIART
jgi:hypothetical protein